MTTDDVITFSSSDTEQAEAAPAEEGDEAGAEQLSQFEDPTMVPFPPKPDDVEAARRRAEQRAVEQAIYAVEEEEMMQSRLDMANDDDENVDVGRCCEV